MTADTKNSMLINDHIQYKNGIKTVCVTACLTFLGIPFDSYRHTSSNKNSQHYLNVIRNWGYKLRSAASDLRMWHTGKYKSKRFPEAKFYPYTPTEVRAKLRKSKFTADDYFLIDLSSTNQAHLVIFDGNGNDVINTAPKSRYKHIRMIKQIL